MKSINNCTTPKELNQFVGKLKLERNFTSFKRFSTGQSDSDPVSLLDLEQKLCEFAKDPTSDLGELMEAKQGIDNLRTRVHKEHRLTNFLHNAINLFMKPIFGFLGTRWSTNKLIEEKTKTNNENTNFKTQCNLNKNLLNEKEFSKEKIPDILGDDIEINTYFLVEKVENQHEVELFYFDMLKNLQSLGSANNSGNVNLKELLISCEKEHRIKLKPYTNLQTTLQQKIKDNKASGDVIAEKRNVKNTTSRFNASEIELNLSDLKTNLGEVLRDVDPSKLNDTVTSLFDYSEIEEKYLIFEVDTQAYLVYGDPKEQKVKARKINNNPENLNSLLKEVEKSIPGISPLPKFRGKRELNFLTLLNLCKLDELNDIHLKNHNRKKNKEFLKRDFILSTSNLEKIRNSGDAKVVLSKVNDKDWATYCADIKANPTDHLNLENMPRNQAFVYEKEFYYYFANLDENGELYEVRKTSTEAVNNGEINLEIEFDDYRDFHLDPLEKPIASFLK